MRLPLAVLAATLALVVGVAAGGPGWFVASAGTAAGAAKRLITGKMVKDGSLSAKDLSARAQAALKGNAGAPGSGERGSDGASVVGPPGASSSVPGPAGPAGANADDVPTFQNADNIGECVLNSSSTSLGVRIFLPIGVQVAYLCSGERGPPGILGQPGQDGLSPSVIDLANGQNGCALGGVLIDALPICQPANGAAGASGQNGSSVTAMAVPAGGNCELGGARLEDSNPATADVFLCQPAAGGQGPAGQDSNVAGPPGEPCLPSNPACRGPQGDVGPSPPCLSQPGQCVGPQGESVTGPPGPQGGTSPPGVGTVYRASTTPGQSSPGVTLANGAGFVVFTFGGNGSMEACTAVATVPGQPTINGNTVRVNSTDPLNVIIAC